jgi:hypothetical protein
MDAKLQAYRNECEALTKQVAAQPMGAYEARELLQKRNSVSQFLMSI